MISQKPPETGAFSFWKTTSWAIYDLANTIFAINILSLYFPLWVLQQGGTEAKIAACAGLSLFLASLLMPFLGTLSDYLGQRMLFLVPATFLCVGATALLARARTLGEGLFFFGLAHIGYQLGLLFYDALLPKVSRNRTLGRISGWGVALGYVGTLIGLFLVRPFVLRGGYQASFLPTALFFLLFSLPCFFLVRETGKKGFPRLSLVKGQTRQRFKKGGEFFKKGEPLRNVARAYFFALLAIQPVVLFMSVYAQRVIGLTDRAMISFFALSTLSAIVGAFGTGLLTDRFGPRRTLLLSLAGWGIGLLMGAGATVPWQFWIVGSVIGASLGGTWVSSRVLIIRLSPPDYLGEVLGIIGFVGRIASVIGPLLWSVIVLKLGDFFPWNYRVALFFLFLWILLSLTELLVGSSSKCNTLPVK